jgi:hypothetical protein
LAADINLIYLLADIQETVILRIEESMKRAGVFRFQDKQKVLRMKSAAGDMRRFVDTTVNYERACDFGDDSDELLKAIECYISEHINH